MTERFTLTYEKLGKYFSMGIVDHKTKEPFNNTTYEFHQCSFKDSKDEMEDLCLLMNELHEENQLLLKASEKDSELIKTLRKGIHQWRKENEWLKERIKELK